MNKEERRTRWHAICREYRQGCETQKAFCRSRGIAVSTLQYWLNKTGTRGAYKCKEPLFTCSLRVGLTVVGVPNAVSSHKWSYRGVLGWTDDTRRRQLPTLHTALYVRLQYMAKFSRKHSFSEGAFWGL
jgi:hypothetical protein